MAYPADIPTFDSVLPGDPTTLPSHSTLHNAVSTALTNVMTTLGTAVNGAAATVRQRFEAIEANDWVTSARIADLSVQRVHIVAGAISTTEVANGTLLGDDLADDAVTDAKTGAPTEGTLDSGKIAYARMGKIVHVWTTGEFSGSATMPSGFRPATAVNADATGVPSVNNFVAARLTISTGGVISVFDGTNNRPGHFSVSYTTP